MPSDNKDGCGISWFWFDEYDRAQNSCRWHDYAYTEQEALRMPLSRKEVDQKFYDMMILQGVGKPKALLYYGIVRLVGGLFW